MYTKEHKFFKFTMEYKDFSDLSHLANGDAWAQSKVAGGLKRLIDNYLSEVDKITPLEFMQMKDILEFIELRKNV